MTSDSGEKMPNQWQLQQAKSAFSQLIMFQPGEQLSGSTMTTLNQEVLWEAVFALPPLGEQSSVVARVEEPRRLCTAPRGRLTPNTQARLAGAVVGSVQA
jgi:hypothetical protein